MYYAQDYFQKKSEETCKFVQILLDIRKNVCYNANTIRKKGGEIKNEQAQKSTVS
nr:MAG TPA: hypothetical protein [Bacteriophage sp.]